MAADGKFFDPKIGWATIIAVAVPLGSLFIGHEVLQWQDAAKLRASIAVVETKIEVQATVVSRYKEDIGEVKQALREASDKLDRLLAQRYGVQPPPQK